MKKYFIVFFLILLCACGKQYQLERTGVEFDADNDNVFDDSFKFDVDNLYDGGAQISSDSRSILKASNYSGIRTLLEIYSSSSMDALLLNKQDASAAATDAELLAHTYNTSIHNETCVAGDGDCGSEMTGNIVSFTRTIAAGKFWLWAENIGGEWKLYRQGFGESSPTEIKGGYIDETGNFVMSGQIDFAGEITVPTQEASNNSNAAASTAFVQAAIAAYLGSASVDTYPAAFPFTPVTDATLDTEYCDNATITDIDSTAPISFTGEGTYQINSGTPTTDSGTVALNDVITSCIQSSTINSTQLTNAINVGGRVEQFSVTTVAGGGVACTGGITFNWPMDADFVTTEDISIDNGGCSAGDLTVTLESAASGEDVSGLGSTGYALYIPGAYDVASFDISSYDLWNYSAGTISFDFRVATWANSGWLFSVVGESSQDQFIIMLYDGDDIRIEYEGANAGPVRATTASAGLVVDTWYHLEAKWRAGATDPSVSVTVNGISAIANTDLTAFDTAPVEMNIGNAGGVAPAFYIKNVRIYDSWQ